MCVCVCVCVCVIYSRSMHRGVTGRDTRLVYCHCSHHPLLVFQHSTQPPSAHRSTTAKYVSVRQLGHDGIALCSDGVRTIEMKQSN